MIGALKIITAHVAYQANRSTGNDNYHDDSTACQNLNDDNNDVASMNLDSTDLDFDWSEATGEADGVIDCDIKMEKDNVQPQKQVDSNTKHMCKDIWAHSRG